MWGSDFVKQKNLGKATKNKNNIFLDIDLGGGGGINPERQKCILNLKAKLSILDAIANLFAFFYLFGITDPEPNLFF